MYALDAAPQTDKTAWKQNRCSFSLISETCGLEDAQRDAEVLANAGHTQS